MLLENESFLFFRIYTMYAFILTCRAKNNCTMDTLLCDALHETDSICQIRIQNISTRERHDVNQIPANCLYSVIYVVIR